MSCSAAVVPQVFSMSMAQFVSVLDGSDAESDNGIKRRVWSNVTVPTASGFPFLLTLAFYAGVVFGDLMVAWPEG